MWIGRRQFLRHSACCLAGGTALYRALLGAAHAGDAQVIAPQRTHRPARANHLIFVFLTGGFSHLDTFDVANGLMREAPEAFDVSRESDATLGLYGIGRGDNRSFGWQCLMARRLVERGVRVVELIDTGSHDNWDAHGDMAQHRGKAARVDRALAGLLRDLRRTGLLDDTLVAICTEFGRTPWTDNATSRGRNHFARVFTSLLAGAGVRGGMTYGETDDYGANIVADPCHVHDYHATILHVMGIDHTRLTYRYAGRDFRLTDVYGNVVQPILV